MPDAGKSDVDGVATEEAKTDEPGPDAAAASTHDNAAEDAEKAVEEAPVGEGDGGKPPVEEAPAGARDGGKSGKLGADTRPEHSEEDELSLGDSDEEEDHATHAAADPAALKKTEKAPDVAQKEEKAHETDVRPCCSNTMIMHHAMKKHYLFVACASACARNIVMFPRAPSFHAIANR
jgi:hypothetical protein